MIAVGRGGCAAPSNAPEPAPVQEIFCGRQPAAQRRSARFCAASPPSVAPRHHTDRNQPKGHEDSRHAEKGQNKIAHFAARSSDVERDGREREQRHADNGGERENAARNPADRVDRAPPVAFGPVGAVDGAGRSGSAAHARQTARTALCCAATKLPWARAGRERRNPGRPSCGITPPYRNGDTAPANSVRPRPFRRAAGQKRGAPKRGRRAAIEDTILPHESNGDRRFYNCVDKVVGCLLSGIAQSAKSCLYLSPGDNCLRLARRGADS